VLSLEYKSNHSSLYSFNIVPAKGLNHSLFFIKLIFSFASGSDGSKSIDLLPKALGPISDLP